MVKRAIETAKLYRFERQFLSGPKKPGCADTPIKKLRRFAKKVWQGNRIHCPKIIAGKGTLHCGRRVSYCQGQSYIELCRSQRNQLVLLHELTHAMGYSTHGKRFCERYFDLLVRHLGYDMHELLLAAEEFKLT